MLRNALTLCLIILAVVIVISESRYLTERGSSSAAGRRRFRLSHPQGVSGRSGAGRVGMGRPSRPRNRPFRHSGNSALKAGEEGRIDFSEQSNSILPDKKSRKPTKAPKVVTTPNPNKINIETKLPDPTKTNVQEEIITLGQTAILHCYFDTIAQIGQYATAQIWWTKQPRRSADRPIILAAGTQIRLPDDRLKIITFPDNSYSILVIQKTISEDEGEYKCSLPTVSGTLTTFTKLTLRDPPNHNVITSQKEQIATSGQDVTMKCQPDNPSLKVWWTAKTSSGENMMMAHGQDKILGAELVLRNVHHRSAGVYTCHVDTEVGNPLRRHFTLQIREKPWQITAYRGGFNLDTFLSKFNKDPEYGDTVQLRCDSGGVPIPTIEWFFKGLRLNNGQKYEMTSLEPTYNTNAVIGRLEIKNFQPTDEGDYSCKMVNDSGERSRDFTVKGFYRAQHIAASSSDDEDVLSNSIFSEREKLLFEYLGEQGSGSDR